MTIICSVAADFTNRDGDIFRVTAKERGVILNAPDWIKDTLMFKLLAQEGSIKYVNSANRIEAENDPLKGLGADGKPIEPIAKKEEKTKQEEVKANEPVVVEAVAIPTEEAPKRSTRKKKTENGDAE